MLVTFLASDESSITNRFHAAVGVIGAVITASEVPLELEAAMLKA